MVRLASKKIAVVPRWAEDEFERKQMGKSIRSCYSDLERRWRRDPWWRRREQRTENRIGKHSDDESSQISNRSHLISGEDAQIDGEKGYRGSPDWPHSWDDRCATSWDRDTDKTLSHYFPLMQWCGLFSQIETNILERLIVQGILLSSTLPILYRLIITALEDRQGYYILEMRNYWLIEDVSVSKVTQLARGRAELPCSELPCKSATPSSNKQT